ncbi:hypothetical protein PMAA_060120 [Talaromyces marneffei ATCC 18224]|uniref:TFIIS N-terminal domain-containing protein n=1 Tax=Talaromyces marneffei (strain ATCC 18224 / CBS 334.59 / QM 7333) TaxID=441960 RepID=B6QMA6_TALMQ|nr:hypothetical protein PMAA_060120 [Talaromyces marneffei ATCC 18224]
MLASVEVDEQESMPDDVILEMKIDKILQGIVDCTRMKEKEDFREICDKARQFLKNWEYLINQATTEEKEEEE